MVKLYFTMCMVIKYTQGKILWIKAVPFLPYLLFQQLLHFRTITVEYWRYSSVTFCPKTTTELQNAKTASMSDKRFCARTLAMGFVNVVPNGDKPQAILCKMYQSCLKHWGMFSTSSISWMFTKHKPKGDVSTAKVNSSWCTREKNRNIHPTT